MFVLDSVNCADIFPTDGQMGGAQIVAQGGSNGGYAAVSGNDVYCQLAYTPDNGVTYEWTPPVHLAPGNLILAPGTRGIRFRNYTAGKVAVVSAGLSEPLEPPLQLTAAGVSTTVAGTMQLVQTIGPLAGAQATLDFQGIPQTSAHLRLVLLARGDAAATGVSVNATFNNDAVAANYNTQRVQGIAAAASAAESVGTVAGVQIGPIAAGTAPAGDPGAIVADVPGYTSTALRKVMLGTSFDAETAVSGGFTARTAGGIWLNTAAVTRITLTPSSGNFAAGSIASLYTL